MRTDLLIHHVVVRRFEIFAYSGNKTNEPYETRGTLTLSVCEMLEGILNKKLRPIELSAITEPLSYGNYFAQQPGKEDLC